MLFTLVVFERFSFFNSKRVVLVVLRTFLLFLLLITSSLSMTAYSTNVKKTRMIQASNQTSMAVIELATGILALNIYLA